MYADHADDQDQPHTMIMKDEYTSTSTMLDPHTAYFKIWKSVPLKTGGMSRNAPNGQAEMARVANPQHLHRERGRDAGAFTYFSCIGPVTERPAGIISMTWCVHSLCSPFLVPPGGHPKNMSDCSEDSLLQDCIIGCDHHAQRVYQLLANYAQIVSAWFWMATWFWTDTNGKQ